MANYSINIIVQSQNFIRLVSEEVDVSLKPKAVQFKLWLGVREMAGKWHPTATIKDCTQIIPIWDPQPRFAVVPEPAPEKFGTKKLQNRYQKIWYKKSNGTGRIWYWKMYWYRYERIDGNFSFFGLPHNNQPHDWPYHWPKLWCKGSFALLQCFFNSKLDAAIKTTTAGNASLLYF